VGQTHTKAVASTLNQSNFFRAYEKATRKSTRMSAGLSPPRPPKNIGDRRYPEMPGERALKPSCSYSGAPHEFFDAANGGHVLLQSHSITVDVRSPNLFG